MAIEAVFGCIRFKNLVLVGEKTRSDRIGTVELLGGKIENGETMHAAVLREIEEESSGLITKDKIKSFGEFRKGDIPVINVVDIELKEQYDLSSFVPEEMGSLHWINYDDIKKFKRSDFIKKTQSGRPYVDINDIDGNVLKMGLFLYDVV